MDKALSFVEYDERVANMIQTVSGTLMTVFREIVANIDSADIPPEEKSRLCAAAVEGVAERLTWHPPVHAGRPLKEYDHKQAVLKAPYASLSRKARKGHEGPVDRFLKQLGGKSNESD